MKEKSFIIRGILAGICISMGGAIYLTAGGPLGAVLFSFGLIAVITMQLNLFTGKAQFVWSDCAGRQTEQGGYVWLLAILLLNIIGCVIMASLFSGQNLIQEKAYHIIMDCRLINPAWKNGLLAIGCGFIMTLAVQNANRKNWLPLIFGIPAFILCGLPHCIADAFYIASLPAETLRLYAEEIISFYLAIVAGNFLGCNLYRLLPPLNPQDNPASH